MNGELKIGLVRLEGREDDVDDHVLGEDEGPNVVHTVVSALTLWHEVVPAYEALEALDLSVVELQTATELTIGSLKVLCSLHSAICLQMYRTKGQKAT